MDIPQLEQFLKGVSAVDLHLDSYNNFVVHELPALLNSTEINLDTVHKEFRYKLQFYGAYVDKACALKNGRYQPITPAMCRKEKMSYMAPVYVSIRQTKYSPDDVLLEIQEHEHIPIAHIPVMLKSCICYANKKIDVKKLESERDDGGYFIINGVERVLVTQKRKCYNYPQVLKVGEIFAVNMRSISKETSHSVLLEFSTHEKAPLVDCSLPYIGKKIPLGILSKAFGTETASQLAKDIGIGCATLARDLEFCFDANYTQDEALEFIGSFATKSQGAATIAAALEEGEEEGDVETDSLSGGEDEISPEEKKTGRLYAQQILSIEMFPHLGIGADCKVKYRTFCAMLRKLFMAKYGFTTEEDRDNILFHRYESSGILLCELFGMFLRNFINSIKDYGRGGGVMDLMNRLELFMTKNIKTCMATGKWGIQKGSYIRQGVSQVLSRYSILGTQSHLHRLMLPVGKEGKNVKVRLIHPSQFGYICLFETPEGQGCGIVLNFTTCVRISKEYASPFIRDIVVQYAGALLDEAGEVDVWVDNLYVFKTRRPRELVGRLEELRLKHILPFQVSISYSETKARQIFEIRVLAEKGRLLRPLLNRKGEIVYIDPLECQTKYIAMSGGEMNERGADYCELHPVLLMSICAGSIPYSDHIQSPRIVYESSMMKQSIGMFATSYPIRYDTTCEVLDYPQKCLLSTVVGRAFGMHDMPSGINCTVAITNLESWNAEDCIVMHKAAIERGLFHSTTYKTVTIEEYRPKSAHTYIFCMPEKTIRKEVYNYSLLDDEGIVKKGSVVKRRDVLVGCVMEIIKKGGKSREVIRKDCSELSDEEGIVESVEVFRTFLGHRMVKIILKVRKIPERGDKFANMNAQKGTCGIQLCTEDMPFCCEDGIVPDIIVNPHALPSRMTISMLMELILGQECCLDGTFRDATFFEPVQAIGDVLHSKGYEKFGMKRMIDGTTGHMFEAQIFCGVNYYQKLKHMVSNKINARNFGNVTALTRQPVSGRSKQGGIRAGEMEVQAILAQGSGAFLWERLVSCSDDFSVLVCARCGIISNDKEQCHVCQEPLYNTILPYASKLVFQLLNSCMISTKFQIKQI